MSRLCRLFFALTIAAMLIYPGGRGGNAGSSGSAFFANFFSAWGQTHIVTAVCFVGVAATPWNRDLRAHNEFVVWASRAFLAAAVYDTAAVVTTAEFPRRFAWVYASMLTILIASAGAAPLDRRPPARAPTQA